MGSTHKQESTHVYWHMYPETFLLTSIQGDVPRRYFCGLIFNLLRHAVFLQDSSYLQMSKPTAWGTPSLSIIRTPWEGPPRTNTPTHTHTHLHLHLPSTNKCSTTPLPHCRVLAHGCQWWEISNKDGKKTGVVWVETFMVTPIQCGMGTRGKRRGGTATCAAQT